MPRRATTRAKPVKPRPTRSDEIANYGGTCIDCGNDIIGPWFVYKLCTRCLHMPAKVDSQILRGRIKR